MWFVRVASAVSICWDELIGGLYPLIRFSTDGVYFFQLTLRWASGGDDVMGESAMERSMGLWSDDRSLMFEISTVWCGNLTKAMSRTSGR